MRLHLILSLVFFSFSLFSASLFLINDSDWKLTSLIKSGDGSYLDQLDLNPNETFRWSTELYDSKVKENQVPKASMTPFTVIWQCPLRGTYSVCYDVPSGATVTASSGVGNHRCTTEEEMKSQKENLQCPPCPACPSSVPQEEKKKETSE